MRCSDCGARIPDEYLDGDSFRCPECGRLYRRVTSDERDVRRRESERRREDAPDDTYADREVRRPARSRYANRGLPPEEVPVDDVPPEDDMLPEDNYGDGNSVPFTTRAADFLTRRVWKFPIWLLFVVVLIIVLVVIFAINGLSRGNNENGSIITATSTPAPTQEIIKTAVPTAVVTNAPLALTTAEAPADVETPTKIYTDVKVPAGSYTVGDKVQAGSYSMRCSSEAGTSSVVSIYPDKNTPTTSNIYTMTASNANISRIDLVDGNVLKIEGSDVYFSTYQ